MKFTAFRMKSTKMFFVVVYDHPRSRYFYALNVYHHIVEKFTKVCWSETNFSMINEIEYITKLSMTEPEKKVFGTKDNIRISHYITNEKFRVKLAQLVEDLAINYLH